MSKHIEIAPLQLLVVGFDQPDFKGNIVKELQKLKDTKLVRIVDGVIIYKKADGKIEVREKSDLTIDEVREYGAVIGALLGIGSGDKDTIKASSYAMATAFEERYEFGLDIEDIKDIAANLPEDSAALIILIEHLWATPLRDALREAGGILLAQDFLSPELLISIGERRYANV